MNAPLLLAPRDGVPSVAHTPEAITDAARRLATGRGPYAIDTERASDFRFDDRAFLIQIRRRDVGTILIAPEGCREHTTEVLAPVLNGADWILHAAASDLPALRLLGLEPGTIFDTEVSGRLLGLEKVNLAALTEEVLGIGLEKLHGNEDWSTWPLPEAWVNYAALDVELLFELAEALTELLDAAGKLHWLEEECEYIVSSTTIPEPSWRDLKGIGKLKSPEQLNIAQVLWERRQELGKQRDRAPHKIISNKALLKLAATLPTSKATVRATLGRKTKPAVAERVLATIKRARSTSRDSWPQPLRPDFNKVPAPRSMWSSQFPDAQESLTVSREALAELSTRTHAPVENLLQPAMLREIIWAAVVTRKVTTSAELDSYMARIGVRRWQRELTAPLLADVLF